MKADFNIQAEQYIRQGKNRKIRGRIVAALSAVVALTTTYVLMLPGITMERDAQCGIEAHQHEASCYTANLLCTEQEREASEQQLLSMACGFTPHQHTDDCYRNGEIACGKTEEYFHEHDQMCRDGEGNLICTLKENVKHKHTGSCYEDINILTCESEESAGHIHEESCYTKTIAQETSCGMEENAGHVHSDDCYTLALTCGTEEQAGHIHSEACKTIETILICTEAEAEAHAHGESCYTTSQVLGCGLAEGEGAHTHNDSCYETVQKQICGQSAGDGAHTHGASCYTTTTKLSCTAQEHTHGDACKDAEGNLTCTAAEHAHGDACYTSETNLTCTTAESAGHVHNDGCYTTERNLKCTVNENAGHVHGDACWISQQTMTCTLNETSGHAHGDACYTTNEAIVCGMNEGDGAHAHTDACYTTVLACGLEEGAGAHAHDESCYAVTEELTCGVEEGAGAHAHSEVCYTLKRQEVCDHPELHEHEASCYETDENDKRWCICELVELQEHQHDADCIVTITVPVEGHAHGEACYEQLLTCTVEEHVHTDDCYPDTTEAPTEAPTVEPTAEPQPTETATAVPVTSEEPTTVQTDEQKTDVDAENTSAPMGETVEANQVEAKPTDIPDAGAATDTDLPADENVNGEEVSVPTAEPTVGPTEIPQPTAKPTEVPTSTVTTATDISTSTDMVAAADANNKSGENQSPVVSDEVGDNHKNTATVATGSDLQPDESADTKNALPLATKTDLKSDADISADFDPSDLSAEETVTTETDLSTVVPVTTPTDIDDAQDATDGETFYCGLTDHEHTYDCLFACGKVEHIHGNGMAVFALFAISDEEHTHGESCYDENGVLVCQLEEHIHTDACLMVADDTSAVMDAADDSLVVGDVTLSGIVDEISYNTSKNEIMYSFDANYAVSFEKAKTATASAPLVIPFEGLDMSSVEVKEWKQGDNEGMYYRIVQNEETKIWEFQIYFDPDEIKADSDDEVKGRIYFKAVIVDSEKNYDGSYTVKVGNETINYTPDEIYGENPSETKDYDLTATKGQGTFDLQNGTLKYEVTLTTSKGTPGSVNLKDVIEISGFTITGTPSVSIQKSNDMWSGYVDTDVKVVLNSFSNNTMDLTVDRLPPPESGKVDYYKITYTYNVDISDVGESLVANNAVTATSTKPDSLEKVTSSSYQNKTQENHIVSKSGSYNEATGLITWTITYNQNNYDIAGSTLTDNGLSSAIGAAELSKSTCSDVNHFALPSDGGITIGEGAKDQVCLVQEGDSYKLYFHGTGDEGKNNSKYTITYSTPAAAAGWTSQNVTNTVTYNKNGDTDSATATVPVSGGSLSKKLNSTPSSDVKVQQLNWRSVINLPAGGISAGTEIRDFLNGYKLNNSDTIVHWYSAAQITALYNAVKDQAWYTASGAKFYVTTDMYGSYDNNGWKEVNEALGETDTTKYVAWKIVPSSNIVPATDADDNLLTSVTLNYSTTADTNAITQEQWYSNKMEIGSKSAEASWNYKVKVLKYDGANSWTTDSTHELDATNKTIKWEVKINLDKNQNYILVKDTMPVITYNGQQYQMKVTEIATGQHTAVKCTPNADGSWAVQLDPYNNAGLGLTVIQTNNIIQLEYKNTNENGSYPQCMQSGQTLIIKFTCELPEAVFALLKDVTANSEGIKQIELGNLKNSVEVSVGEGENTEEYGVASQTQKITIKDTTGATEKVDDFGKDGTWDNSKHLLNYVVDINRNEANLNTTDDKLVLTDQLTFDSPMYYGWNDSDYHWVSVPVYATLQMDTVQLYYAQTAADGSVLIDENGNLTAGARVPVSDWSMTYNAGSHTMTLTVPDEEALVLKYAYNIELDVENLAGSCEMQDNTNTHKNCTLDSYDISGKFTNTLKYNNSNQSSHSTGSGDAWQAYTSGATMNTSQSFYKVDSNDNSIVLEGAVFELRKWDAAQNNWVATKYTFTSDEKGQFTLADITYTYDKNTAYRIVEIEAPFGYKIDANNPYSFDFYFAEKAAEGETVSYVGPDGFPNNFTDLSGGGSVATIGNTKQSTSVTVQKEWEGSNQPDSVKVYLHRYALTDAQWQAVKEYQEENNSGSEEVVKKYTISIYCNNSGEVFFVESKEVSEGSSVKLKLNSQVVGTDFWNVRVNNVAGNFTYKNDEYLIYYVINNVTSNIDVVIDHTQNKLTPGKIEYEVTDSSGNNVGSSSTDDFTPDRLTAALGSQALAAAKDSFSQEMTLYSSKSWKATSSNLALLGKDAAGNTLHYVYYVEEAALAGWTSAVEGGGSDDGYEYTITNTADGSTITTTSMAVEKVWQDGNGSVITDESQKSPVEVQIYWRDTVANTDWSIYTYEGKTIFQLSSANEWKAAFTGLQDQKIVTSGENTTIQHDYEYKIVETTTGDFVTDYNTTTNDDGTTSVVITNRKSQITEIHVQKAWADNVTEKNAVKVYLRRYKVLEGASVDEANKDTSFNSDNSLYLTLSEGAATGSFTSLAASVVENDVTYTYYYYVEEDATDAANYSVTYAYNNGITGNTANNPIVVTNSFVEGETTSVHVVKKWTNGQDIYTKDNGTVYFILKRYAGTDAASAERFGSTVYTVTSAEGWSKTVDSLPAKDSNGNAYTYMVVETDSTGMVEVPASAVTVTGSGTQEAPYVMTNVETSITAEKVWSTTGSYNADEYPNVTIQLYKRVGTATTGTAVGEPVTLGESTNGQRSWSYTWDKLPVVELVNNAYQQVTYYVEEAAVDGFTPSYQVGESASVTTAADAATASGAITVTNTEVNETDIAVEKVWKDAAGNELATPPETSVTLTLKRKAGANGAEETVQNGTVTLPTTENAWKTTVTGLPKYAAVTNGDSTTYTEYIYYFEETVPEGYAVSYSNVDENGAFVQPENGVVTVTNTEATSLKIKKVWDDNESTERPDSIVLDVYQNVKNGENGDENELVQVTFNIFNAASDWYDKNQYKEGYNWNIIKGKKYKILISVSGTVGNTAEDLFDRESGKRQLVFEKDSTYTGEILSLDDEIRFDGTDDAKLTGTITIEFSAPGSGELSFYIGHNGFMYNGEIKSVTIDPQPVQAVSVFASDTAQPYRTITLPDSNGNWEIQLDDLEAGGMVDGELVTYTYEVVESVPEGYTASYSSETVDGVYTVTITNTKSADVTTTKDLTINKTWSGAEDYKPETIHFTVTRTDAKLTENNTATFDVAVTQTANETLTVVLGDGLGGTAEVTVDSTTDADDWTLSLTGLPGEGTVDGVAYSYSYTVAEVPVAGFTSSDTKADPVYSYTNTRDKINVSVQKKWELSETTDTTNLTASLVLKRYILDGENKIIDPAFSRTRAISYSNTETWTESDLPTYGTVTVTNSDNTTTQYVGKQFYYYVEEVVDSAHQFAVTYSVDGGTTKVVTPTDATLTSTGTLTVTNAEASMTTISAEKKWQDENGNEIAAPDDASVELQLYRTTLNQTQWETFLAEMQGNTTGGGGSSGSGETVTLTVKLQDNANPYATVYLDCPKKNEVTVIIELINSEIQLWHLGLWQTDDGVKAVKTEDRVLTVTVPAKYTEENYTLTVNAPVSSRNSEDWRITIASSTYSLQRAAATTDWSQAGTQIPVGNPVTLPATDTSTPWQHTWSDQPSHNGEEYYFYYVGEVTEHPGYKPSVTYTYDVDTATYSYTVTNKETVEVPTTGSLTVNKAWVYAEGTTLPESISFMVQRAVGNGSPTNVGDKYTLTAANNWSVTIDNLDLLDDNGQPYTYSVVEDTVEGFYTEYSASVTLDEEETRTGTITITNKEAGKKYFNLSTKKEWHDEINAPLKGETTTFDLYQVKTPKTDTTKEAEYVEITFNIASKGGPTFTTTAKFPVGVTVEWKPTWTFNGDFRPGGPNGNNGTYGIGTIAKSWGGNVDANQVSCNFDGQKADYTINIGEITQGGTVTWTLEDGFHAYAATATDKWPTERLRIWSQDFRIVEVEGSTETNLGTFNTGTSFNNLILEDANYTYSYYVKENGFEDYVHSYDSASSANGDQNITIHNTWIPTTFTVTKQWLDEEGHTMTAPDYYILFNIERTDGKKDPALTANPYRLDATNNWKMEFTHLADHVSYEVTEQGVYKGDGTLVSSSYGTTYHVSYNSDSTDPDDWLPIKAIELNGWNKKETARITNQLRSGYVLPETGGEGTQWYTGAGAMLIGIALTLLYKGNKRRRRAEEQ